MATKAQKTAEVTSATRRVETTQSKLTKAQAEVASLTKLLKSQTDHLEWVKGMPVDDDGEEAPAEQAETVDPFAEADSK